MKTLILCVVMAALFASAGRAEARIFEPQPHWWSAGRTCIATRDPAGLGWESSPPRACVARAGDAEPKARLAISDAKADVDILALADDKAAKA